MKKRIISSIIFILIINCAFTQESEEQQAGLEPQVLQTFGAYLIPRQIYIGDPATLVLPLPASEFNSEDIVLTKYSDLSDENNFPSHENIDFYKIILERRTAGNRLIIEFTAFIPGEIALPSIEIGGEIFSGLSITVNSIIDGKSDRMLSGAAPALAMPGTAQMLYGSLAGIIFLIAGTIWFILKGRAFLEQLREKWKRLRLFSGIRVSIKKIQRGFLKGIEKRFILDKLSDVTRNFLSILTNKNCRSMTASEFDTLAILVTQNTLVTLKLPEPASNELHAVRFGDFFHKCDKYRFSGIKISDKDISSLLEDLLKKIDILEKAKKNEKQMEGDAA